MNNKMEIVLCEADIFYFIEKYLEIELKPHQEDILERYYRLSNGKTINIQSIRQSGISTINAIYALWILLFKPETKIALISPTHQMYQHEKQVISKLYDRFITKLDSNQEIPIYYSKYKSDKINFSNNSYIIFGSDISKNLRGQAFDLIIYDSLFLCTNSYDCFIQTFPQGNKCIISNTTVNKNSDDLEKYGDIYTYLG